MSHPEEPAAADAAAGDSSSKGEDEAIKKQLMDSVGADEVPRLEVLCISRLHAASREDSSKHLVSCACKGISSRNRIAPWHLPCLTIVCPDHAALLMFCM